MFISVYLSIEVADQMILSGLIFLGTVILDFIITAILLKESVEKLFPLLNLPSEAQEDGVKFLINFNEVINSKPILESSIAKDSIEEVKRVVTACLSDSEFTVHDLVGPNRHLLNSLKEGDTFDAVSIMSDKNSWVNETPESYLNIRKSNENIKIRRVFIFKTESEYKDMLGIMTNLIVENTEVRYIFKSNIALILDYRDFSLSSSQKVALGAKCRQEVPSLRVIRNKDDVNSMNRQFNELFDESNIVEC